LAQIFIEQPVPEFLICKDSVLTGNPLSSNWSTGHASQMGFDWIFLFQCSIGEDSYPRMVIPYRHLTFERSILFLVPEYPLLIVPVQ